LTPVRNFHIFIAIDMKRSIEMKALTGKIAIITGAGPNGIRVNAILPGAVDTPLYRQMNSTAEAQTFVTALHALKRVATPEEIARSVFSPRMLPRS
jgi:enoyl-[acyl-carrier-protein] reductase (NADH)